MYLIRVKVFKRIKIMSNNSFTKWEQVSLIIILIFRKRFKKKEKERKTNILYNINEKFDNRKNLLIMLT